MKVLIIKTSSLGDVIHTLPALTDAASAIPGISFDWLVEEAFAEVPCWHPAVSKVIPVALRRWRKSPVKAWRSGEWKAFRQLLSGTTYDAVIDAQGLLKSAWLSRYAKGCKYGFDRASAREAVAARFYDRCVAVARGQHAVERTRQLFAQSLGYELGPEPGQYSLSIHAVSSRQIVLLHGTTWSSKHWPEAFWQQLAVLLVEAGYRVLLPWGNRSEQQRAERIARATGAEVLPKSSLTELAQLLANSSGCVSVDTGLGHLAAAVGVPTVSLFGATNTGLTGFYGDNQAPLQAEFPCSPCMRRDCKFKDSGGTFPPCYETLPPALVFEHLQSLVNRRQLQ